MDPESKRLLENNLELSQENNKMLHKVRRVQQWEAFWRWLKLLAIIGIALGSFYYIQPYVDKLVNLYNSVAGVEQKVNDPGSFQDLMKKFAN